MWTTQHCKKKFVTLLIVEHGGVNQTRPCQNSEIWLNFGTGNFGSPRHAPRWDELGIFPCGLEGRTCWAPGCQRINSERIAKWSKIFSKQNTSKKPKKWPFLRGIELCHFFFVKLVSFFFPFNKWQLQKKILLRFQEKKYFSLPFGSFFKINCSKHARMPNRALASSTNCVSCPCASIGIPKSQIRGGSIFDFWLENRKVFFFDES